MKNKEVYSFPKWNHHFKTVSLFSHISERVKYKALRNSSSGFIKRSDVRNAVFERDNFRCVICGSYDNLEVDHIHAVYSVLQGKYPLCQLNTLDNLQTLCKHCNSSKKP